MDTNFIMRVADDLIPAIKNGDTTVIIRKGDQRKSHVGLATIEPTSQNGKNFNVMVEKVEVKTLAELTDAELAGDGAESPEQMQTALQRFYPDITLQEPITVFTLRYPKFLQF